MTSWARRHPARSLGVIGLAVILGIVGFTTAGHVRADRKVKAREAAKAKSFSLAKARSATRAATGATTATAPARLAIARPTSTTFYNRATVTIQWDGLTRDYLVFRPRVVTVTSLPVIVHLSGSAIDAAGEAARANYLQVARQAIIVYPDATDINGARNWDSGQCCGAASTGKVDDVGFIEDVIKQVRTQPDAASGRVYMSGYSNGGKMALLMACDDPGDIAAVAVYGAVPTFTCPGQKAVSLLEMAGTADTDVTVGPGGPQVVQAGFTEPRVTTVVDAQLRIDGCTAASEEGRAGALDELMWPTCAGGRRVGLAVWTGETHAWPQMTASSPSAQQVMWSFFESLGAGG